MLQKQAVEANTLELLKRLMKEEVLQPFFLVGGTSLALQIGHRTSVDIDLFTLDSFDVDYFSTYLQHYYSFQADFFQKNTLKGFSGNIKIDLITHAYRLVEPLIKEENIRMAGVRDIAAMKLNAIVGNGSRIKDFVDIAFLSSRLSLDQMLKAYEYKYEAENSIIVLKSLTYFNDINFKEDVHLLNLPFQWKEISTRLYDMIKEPQAIFPVFK